ncbi:MAG: UvrD-helicase domain-containing protein [Syntrophobacteraceae bacterium]
MELDEFIAECAVLDLEAGGDRIYRIGAILGEEVFERKEKFEASSALEELDRFAGRAEFLLGHNILEYDLPLLKRVSPALAMHNKPVIDTLFLSPLAFPENPYHRLVKDYKLVRDAVNDPVADSRLALSVFRDQWEKFSRMAAEGRSDILSFYLSCFRSQHEFWGICRLFQLLGAWDLGEDEARAIFTGHVSGQVCRTGLEEVLGRGPLIPALSYVLAWLRVAGGNSVLPPWVRKSFPEIGGIVGKLRDIPCSESDCAWCRAVHDSTHQLRRFFDFSDFRAKPAAQDGESLQRKVVAHGIEGRPLLAIFPTGGGKSLCYQLPALVHHYRRGALTIVISPLQALMKDQVDNLAAKTGTPYAAALNGLLTPPERGDVLERTARGDIALLYVAPEQFRNASFRKAISRREIGAWVFDEAHCLSKWGHDFRPDYLYAGRFIREYSAEQNVAIAPVYCFTATAKRDVMEEITDFFQREVGQNLLVFEGGLERENLQFEVRTCSRSEKLSTIQEVLGEHLPENLSGGAIVYVATRQSAESTARFLSMQGWRAAPFHAGLEPSVKNLVQEEFLFNRDWDSIIAIARKRHEIARLILETIVSKIPSDTTPSADLLVGFSSEELAASLKSHLFLSRISDPLAAIDRGLLYLHEQRAIILQQGLAVFRQAMSIRVFPEESRRKYSKSDYEPLAHHYRERIFQVHGMTEYARLGAQEIGRALELVISYFTLSKVDFIRRYFPGKKEMLERATSRESYRKIVEDLANPSQTQIVSGDEHTNTLILAGPGSGKTKVIVHRCAYLLRVLRVNPESILIVCFNHSAAIELRRRLFELAGEDSAGVTVQTYHGIAMRLTGTSFSDLVEKGSNQEQMFDSILTEAIQFLTGDKDIPGMEPDAVRERLLGKFRYILVDEYQDIDRKQYDLVSALAGRTEKDPDTRLTICAVGDDDQNIYAFRGSNVTFLVKFRED